MPSEGDVVAAELHVLAHMKLFLSSLLLLLIFLLLFQLLMLICVLLLQLLMLMFVLLLSVSAASLAQSLPASTCGAVCPLVPARLRVVYWPRAIIRGLVAVCSLLVAGVCASGFSRAGQGLVQVWCRSASRTGSSFA